ELVLVPASGEFSATQIAAMQDITATPHPTKPAGGVVFAATWPSMVQLAADLPWHPMPELTGALAAEIARRSTITPVEDATGLTPPPGKAVRDYQAYG